MPKYTGLTLGAGVRMQISQAVLPEAWSENLTTSKYGSRWIGSGVAFRKTWANIGPSGLNWGTGSRVESLFSLESSTGEPWDRLGIFITSAHIWTNVGGTGTFHVGCGCSAGAPVNENVIQKLTLTAGLEWRMWAKTDFEASFERGRLVHKSGNQFRLRYDGGSLTSGPSDGSGISVAAFGVIVPDPSVSDS